MINMQYSPVMWKIQLLVALTFAFRTTNGFVHSYAPCQNSGQIPTRSHRVTSRPLKPIDESPIYSNQQLCAETRVRGGQSEENATTNDEAAIQATSQKSSTLLLDATNSI